MAKNKGGGKKAKKSAFDITHFWNKHWARILVTVLVFGILAFIGINKLIIYQQKQQFDAAEASVDRVYGKMTSLESKPVGMSKSKSCNNAASGILHGSAACTIGMDIYFKPSNIEEAIKTADSVDSLIKADVTLGGVHFISVEQAAKGFVALTGETGLTERVIGTSKTQGGLLCSGAYYYSDDLAHSKVSSAITPSDAKLLVKYACNGDTNQIIYPSN